MKTSPNFENTRDIVSRENKQASNVSHSDVYFEGGLTEKLVYHIRSESRHKISYQPKLSQVFKFKAHKYEERQSE